MDPIGFGLENFDAIGRWRDKESILLNVSENDRAPRKSVELALETTGEIAGLSNSAFSDSKQLGAILAESRLCQECIVKQLFRYAHGRRETSVDQPEIQQLFATFRDSGFHFKDLLIAVARSPEFLRGLDRRER